MLKMNYKTLVTISVLLIWVISGCSLSKQNRHASITFSIEELQNDTIRLWQSEPLEHSRINTQELIVDESGFGTFTLDYPNNSFVTIKIQDFEFSILHTSGSALNITGKASDLPNTLEISGEDSLPNNYLLAKKAIIRKYNSQDGRFFFQLDSSDFWFRLSAMNTEIDSLNKWLESQDIRSDLEALLILESQHTSNVLIMNHALVKGYTGPRYSIDISYDENLFQSYSGVYSAVLGYNYELQLLRPFWMNFGAANNDSLAYIFPKAFYEAIDTLGVPEFAKNYYKARLLSSYFRANQSNPWLEEIYDNWTNEHPNSIFRNTVAEAYNGMSTLAPGKRAPIITGVDQNGNEFSTEQFRGNYVYIDVWATWCSSCVEKIRKMYSLQEEYKDNTQIKFLFISIDQDLEKWKKYISKLPDKVLQINSNWSRLQQDYMLQGIPRYILIDPEGNIYNSNAPDPDSDEIKSILEMFSESTS